MRMFRIKKQFLDLITSGQKTYEIRAESSRIKNVVVGDELLFVSGPHKALTVVTSIQKFLSREEMIKSVPLDALGADSEEEVRGILKKIYPQDPPLLAWGIEVGRG